MILAGDIGGTKTVLALFEPDGEDLRPVREATFPSRDHATFEEILDTFLDDAAGAKPEAACFGVAGAVIDGRVQTTNLPWTLERRPWPRPSAPGTPRCSTTWRPRPTGRFTSASRRSTS